MKILPLLSLLLSTLLPLPGQEAPSQPITESATRIQRPLSDEVATLPIPETQPVQFRVKKTRNQLLHTETVPEIPGTPAFNGSIKVTVQLVDDPGFIDTQPPLPTLEVEDPAVQGRLDELRDQYEDTQLIFCSATVYDRSRTYLRVYANGEAREEAGGWSNLDFNHFSGLSSFQVKGTDGKIRSYVLLMGIANEGTETSNDPSAAGRKLAQLSNRPEVPDLLTFGPAFVLTQGSRSSDPEAVRILDDLHELYRVEGQAMKTDSIAEAKALEARKAFLIKNPPVPKDITIQFWKRNQPVFGVQLQPEGAQ